MPPKTEKEKFNRRYRFPEFGEYYAVFLKKSCERAARGEAETSRRPEKWAADERRAVKES